MPDVDRFWMVHRGLVLPRTCHALTRRLWLEVRRCGLSVEDMREWSTGTWWPTLRIEPEVYAIVQQVQHLRGEGEEWAEPQLLVRLPDEDGTEVGGPHLDEPPPWAADRGYRAIYGVELTDTPQAGGSPVLYDHDEMHPAQPRLNAGDVLEMGPDLPHSGTPNLSGSVRMALYLRLLSA